MYRVSTTPHYIREPNKKITIDQWIFLLGILVKQFYLLPSGSFQIGDMLLMLGCFLSLFLTKRGRAKISAKDQLILVYMAAIAIINFYYSIVLHSPRMNKPIIYYLYNVIVILTFDAYLAQNNNEKFLKGLSNVLKISYVLQLALLVTGLGRWIYSDRYGGTFNDPNQYGVFIFFCMLMIYLIDHALGKKYWAFWCVLGTILTLPSTSTGNMVGIIAFWIGVYINEAKTMKWYQQLFWACILFIVAPMLYLGLTGVIQMPSFIANNSMFIRFSQKVSKVTSGGDASSLVADRGWAMLFDYPQYLFLGAGEGRFDRFNASLEIHSSILGPLFYYGIFVFSIFILWFISKVKKNRYLFVYIALFAEAVFLLNTRQPLYWMIIAMGDIKLLERGYDTNKPMGLIE